MWSSFAVLSLDWLWNRSLEECWAARCSHLVERCFPLSIAVSCRCSVATNTQPRSKMQRLEPFPPSINIIFNSRPAYPHSPVPEKVILYAWPFRMKTSSDTSRDGFTRHTRSFLQGSAAPTSLFSLMVRGKDCTVTTSPWPLTCR